MALRHGTVATATTAVKVFSSTGKAGFVTIKNEDASIKVFVGGATVTNSGATAGVSLAAGQSMQLPDVAGDDVYVASASATPSVSFIFSG